MVRKGTKQQYKPFNAPSEMATNLKQQAMADRLEMERVKRYDIFLYFNSSISDSFSKIIVYGSIQVNA